MKSNHKKPVNKQPHFTCPECGMTSYHPKDIEYQYCGNCHAVTGGKPALFIVKNNDEK